MDIYLTMKLNIVIISCIAILDFSLNTWWGNEGSQDFFHRLLAVYLEQYLQGNNHHYNKEVQ